MPTMASTMPSRRLRPRHVSKNRPRLCLMSLSARFTSRPAASAGCASFAQISLLVDDHLALQLGCDLDASVKKSLAELDSPLGQAAILKHPDHARAALISFNEFKRHEKPVCNYLLDDFNFRLLAQ